MNYLLSDYKNWQSVRVPFLASSRAQKVREREGPQIIRFIEFSSLANLYIVHFNPAFPIVFHVVLISSTNVHSNRTAKQKRRLHRGEFIAVHLKKNVLSSHYKGLQAQSQK